jgi:adenosylcobinamide-GDP ribazoletransferase
MSMAEPRETGAAPPEDGPAALASHAHVNAPRALAAQLATAVRFLTVLPAAGASVALGESALFFPLVGLGIGGLLVAADRALAPLVPTVVDGAALVALLATITAGRHLRGLANAADTLAVRDRARALAVMRDGATGALGVAAVALVLGIKVACLAVLPTANRTAALLYAPMLARWAVVVLAFGSRPARGEGVGFAIVGSLTFREFGLATVFALWLALAGMAARGLVAVLVLAIVTITGRILAHRKLGGVTGDLLGAITEIAEVLVLLVFI